MNKPLIALACFASLAIAGCQPDAAAPATDTADAGSTVAPAATPTEIMPASEPLSSDTAPGFDMKGFAGTFTGTVPCDGCPASDTNLVLNPDGTYLIRETAQDGDDAVAEMDGTWTVEADNSQVRLDPNSKEEQDRLFAIASDEQLTALAPDGQPLPAGSEHSLTRQSQ